MLLEHAAPPAMLGVILPGYGYTAAMPLLYYATSALASAGADVLQVRYNYPGQGVRVSDDGFTDRLHQDVAVAVAAAHDYRGYSQTVWVGKSLGTLAMSLIFSGQTDARAAVWLTPMLNVPQVYQGLLKCPVPSLVVIGTADPHYDLEKIAALEQAGHRVLSLEGADHGLDVQGDPLASVQHLHESIAALQQMLTM